MRKYLCLLFVFVGVAAAGDVERQSNPPIVQEERSGQLGLEGAPNFRDIGGYSTGDGRHVRWNRVYRSSELSKLTPADAEKVKFLNIVSVVDLRTNEERARARTVWLQPPNDTYESPKESLDLLMHTTLANAQTTEGARSGMIAMYRGMPDEYKAEYSAMFHRIAAGTMPILVHCTAGKDRTGVAIGLLLTAVGVPRDEVLANYVLTEKLVQPPDSNARQPAPVGGAAQAKTLLAQLPAESRIVLLRADPDYLSAALDSVNREYGSVDAYIRRALGLSSTELRKLRAALLD
jgi:protein-tyrosine phosphatase